ncbi:MAG: tRNA1(Val) (adenine(37)-N6)-methyltransferase [Bacteroidia bacterium]
MPFTFKQFTVDDNLCAMKIGTDAVLLGAWTTCNKAQQILDIGTGSGILALMMAQKSQAEITAIEIEEMAFKQAQINFQNSKWADRINLIHSSIQDFTNLSDNTFDVIICNPPYFKNSLKPHKKERTIARHNETLNCEDLFKCAANLMHEESYLNLIYPAEYFEILLKEASKNKLHLIKRCDIHPNINKVANRMMLCFSKKTQTLIHEKIIIELDKRHHFSNEYINLTKDFYLKF